MRRVATELCRRATVRTISPNASTQRGGYKTHACKALQAGFSPSNLPTEFLLYLRKRNLDHRRPSMGTAIRQIAVEQIANQFLYFGITQRIIGFDGVPTYRLGNHLFAQSHR